MCRRHRFLAACLAAFALVFAQIAVAAHACPMIERASPSGASAGHACCPDLAADESGGDANVCIQHCAYGHASVDSPQPLQVALNVATPGLRVEAVEPAAAGDSRPPWGRAAGPAWPPVAILFGVLRI